MLVFGNLAVFSLRAIGGIIVYNHQIVDYTSVAVVDFFHNNISNDSKNNSNIDNDAPGQKEIEYLGYVNNNNNNNTQINKNK